LILFFIFINIIESETLNADALFAEAKLKIGFLVHKKYTVIIEREKIREFKLITCHFW